LSLPFDDLTAVADFLAPALICSRSNQARPGVDFHPQLHLQQLAEIANSSLSAVAATLDSSSTPRKHGVPNDAIPVAQERALETFRRRDEPS
jgi:hypothetical protein